MDKIIAKEYDVNTLQYYSIIYNDEFDTLSFNAISRNDYIALKYVLDVIELEPIGHIIDKSYYEYHRTNVMVYYETSNHLLVKDVFSYMIIDKNDFTIIDYTLGNINKLHDIL